MGKTLAYLRLAKNVERTSIPAEAFHFDSGFTNSATDVQSYRQQHRQNQMLHSTCTLTKEPTRSMLLVSALFHPARTTCHVQCTELLARHLILLLWILHRAKELGQWVPMLLWHIFLQVKVMLIMHLKINKDKQPGGGHMCLYSPALGRQSSRSDGSTE